MRSWNRKPRQPKARGCTKQNVGSHNDLLVGHLAFFMSFCLLHVVHTLDQATKISSSQMAHDYRIVKSCLVKPNSTSWTLKLSEVPNRGATERFPRGRSRTHLVSQLSISSRKEPRNHHRHNHNAKSIQEPSWSQCCVAKCAVEQAKTMQPGRRKHANFPPPTPLSKTSLAWCARLPPQNVRNPPQTHVRRILARGHDQTTQDDGACCIRGFCPHYAVCHCV